MVLFGKQEVIWASSSAVFCPAYEMLCLIATAFPRVHINFPVWPEGPRERSLWFEKAKAAYGTGREVGVAWTTVHYPDFLPLD